MLLPIALCNIPSLQSLALTCSTLGNAGFAELAPSLYHNTSIKVLNISGMLNISGNDDLNDYLNDMKSAEIPRDLLRSNKTMTALDLSGNEFGLAAGVVECIADGLGSNSTLLKINLSRCRLEDDDVSILAQTLGSRNTTLQKLDLCDNYIDGNDEGASLLARSLGNNALPNLTRLSLSECGIVDDNFIALMSALEQNTSLLHLELRDNHRVSERAFLALAESLPKTKVLQQVDLSWCRGLASATPLLLAGLRKNTSLFRFHVDDCAPSYIPPTTEDTARYAGGWIQEMERLGCRNHFLY